MVKFIKTTFVDFHEDSEIKIVSPEKELFDKNCVTCEVPFTKEVQIFPDGKINYFYGIQCDCEVNLPF